MIQQHAYRKISMVVMKRIALGLLGTAMSLHAFAQQPAKPRTTGKMNVVLFLVDDMGWSDLGCYGSSLYRTPHIDHMAKKGVRFTQAYAASHVCSPSRGAIISGQYPARTHLTDWLPGRKNFP